MLSFAKFCQRHLDPPHAGVTLSFADAYKHRNKKATNPLAEPVAVSLWHLSLRRNDAGSNLFLTNISVKLNLTPKKQAGVILESITAMAFGVRKCVIAG
jgi:hypothetical protein